MTAPKIAADLHVPLPALPLDRSFDPVYAEAVTVSPLIRRVLARNPSAFTFHGTGTYVVGHGRVAVIDPGPLLTEHVAALQHALAGETVTHILVTHTHSDHSPAAAPLKAATGAPTYGYGPHGGGCAREGIALDEGGDLGFVPDVTVTDGMVIAGDGWTIECVYTPGHTSNHVCYALREEGTLFPGDHVMGWSTTVIVPPDGDMAAYFASLHKLAARDDRTYYPTHGGPIREPRRFVEALIEHRRAREAQIETCVRAGLTTLERMVPVIYSETDPKLHPAASMSVRAHLEHLVARGRLTCEGAVRPGVEFRLAGA